MVVNHTDKSKEIPFRKHLASVQHSDVDIYMIIYIQLRDFLCDNFSLLTKGLPKMCIIGTDTAHVHKMLLWNSPTFQNGSFVFYTEHTEVYSVDLVQAVLGVYDIKLHVCSYFSKQLLSQVIK